MPNQSGRVDRPERVVDGLLGLGSRPLPGPCCGGSLRHPVRVADGRERLSGPSVCGIGRPDQVWTRDNLPSRRRLPSISGPMALTLARRICPTPDPEAGLAASRRSKRRQRARVRSSARLQHEIAGDVDGSPCRVARCPCLVRVVSVSHRTGPDLTTNLDKTQPVDASQGASTMTTDAIWCRQAGI